MYAIYNMHNMLAIYLAVLPIEYMLAIYYNKTIAREQTKDTGNR